MYTKKSIQSVWYIVVKSALANVYLQRISVDKFAWYASAATILRGHCIVSEEKDFLNCYICLTFSSLYIRSYSD